MSNHEKDKHVVVIGANFAGLSAAMRLAARPGFQVTLADPSPVFQWAPNIHEIVSGVKSPQGVVLSIQKLAAQRGVLYLDDRAEALSLEQNEVQLADGEILPFDALLVSCGMSASGLDIPGAAEHSIGFRRAEEARRIQQRIAVGLAEKKRLSVTIVGAGFTGIEVLGELLRKHRHSDALSINIVEAAPRVLAGLPEVIGEDVQKQCADLPVDFYLSSTISRVEKDALHLASGREIKSDVVIWCAGTTLPGFVEHSGLETSARGILVEDTLQTTTASNVFAAGDIAATDTPLKKQASYAMDMGKHAAANIERYLGDEMMRPFIPFHKPLLLSFGDLNTYFIYNNTVLASPLLAPLKEAVYQLYMAQFSSSLPAAEQGFGLVGRYSRSVKNLFLPELIKFRFAHVLGRSRRLQ